MKKVLSFLKDYKLETILAPLFKMLEAIFELFVPLVMADIIDIGITNRDASYIFQKVLILVLLGIIGLACSLTAQFFAAKAATSSAAELRMALYSHIQRLSFRKLDQIGTSTMITRLTADANQVQNGINMTLRLLLRSPFIVFGAMIMAFIVDARGALTFAVVIPLLGLVVFIIMALTIPLFRKVQGGLDQVLSSTRENLTGVRVIRAFHKEEQETEQFRARNQGLTKLQLLVGRISGLMNPLTYVLINVATVVLIYVGALQVNIGELTRGEVVALVNYMSQILVELIKLANLIILTTKLIASARRIESVFNLPADETHIQEDAQERAEKARVSVEFRNVGLRYEAGADEALTDVSFSAKEGQTIGVIGGTGCGKSSLVQLIPAFYPATSGCVLVNGENVEHLDPVFVRHLVGIVPQKAVLFQGSIRENLCMGMEEMPSDEVLWRALDAAQATSFVKEKEGELSFEISQGGKNLSGGQKQRLTIARALVRNPKILILDDSASALDYATDAALRTAIRNLPERPLTFIVSQRTSSIMQADQIIVLEDGDVVGVGTHEQLLASCETYKEIYDSQFGGEAKQ